MILSHDEYRNRIVSFVECPRCKAKLNEDCHFDYKFGERAHAERRTAYDNVQHLDPRTEEIK